MKTSTLTRTFQDTDLELKTLMDLDERFFHVPDLCPVAVTKDRLILAVTDSFSDFRTLDNLKKSLSKNTMLLKAEPDHLSSLKKIILSHRKPDHRWPDKEPQDHVRNKEAVEDLKLYTGDLSDTVKLVNRIIIQGFRERATDIHIQRKERTVQVRYRIDGILYDALSFNADIYDNLITRFKVLSRLDIAQARLPQSGRTTVRIDQDTISLRISTLPSRSGEKISIRFLYSTQDLLPIDELGLSQEQIKRLLAQMNTGKGIFIIGGPTGTGKTTTLYSIIQRLNDGRKNIITLEDPAEIEIGGSITQVQVNAAQGLSFTEGIRAILRHDPDIILVGEIRDSESAQTAFEASLTGHLVLTTMHMPTVMDIVERLFQLKIDPLTIESSLIGAATQRLVRKICPECSQKIKPDSEAVRFFSDFGLEIKYDFITAGCQNCRSRGYWGRTGLFDIRYSDNSGLRSCFESRDHKALKRKEKYQQLAISALEAIHKGMTDSREIMRSLW